MAIETGKMFQPLSAMGVPLVETAIFAGPAGTKSTCLVTPDLTDRTSWYQKSVRITDEVLTDSGDGLTFTSANPWWVNVYGTLTYYHKQIPKRDGTWGRHSDWAVIVKVDEVVQTSDFTINYTSGQVTFSVSQSGKTIKATYSHTNGVTNPSEWLLTPGTGKKYVVEHCEVQFSKNVQIQDTIRFEIWAGANLATYGNFPDYLWEAGYGQMRADYRNARDLINAANEGKGVIPVIGELTQEVCVIPFNYIQAFTLDSAFGTIFRLCLVNNTPFVGELCTATFYFQISNS